MMNEVNKKTQVQNSIHNIILEGRKKMSVSGVTDVDSFDENTECCCTPRWVS